MTDDVLTEPLPLGPEFEPPTEVTRRISDAAVEVVTAEYRTDAWYAARRASVSASEVAAICNVPGAYDSAFNLWWSKRTGEGGSDDTKETRRGRRVEPLVLEDFADDYPGLTLRSGLGLVRNVDQPWMVATPDAIAYDGFTGGRRAGEGYAVGADDWAASLDPVATIEAKTAGGPEGWGERGTDAIPVHYRAQALWQMAVLGVDLAYVPVWIGFDYRLYVIERDTDAQLDIEWMAERAAAFLDTLDAGLPPDLDGHDATTRRLRQLHEKLDDTTAELDPHVVAQFQAARRLRDAASDRMDLALNRMRADLGRAAIGNVGGRKVVSRSVYDVPARTQEVKAFTVDKLNVSKPRTTTTRKRVRP
jgi:putative phage-type endonuclease